MIENKRQSLPKAVRISEMLIREIAAGRFADGERLPTERAMAQQYGVAVGTLRRALGILEHKGLLRRVQGSGNYVQYKHDVHSVYGFFRLELLNGGGLPSAQILHVLRCLKPDDVPDIGPDRLAHRIRRLRVLNAKPVALEEIWLDGRFCDWVHPEEVVESLYVFYRTRLKLVIGSVVDQVGVSSVPEWAPDGFGLRPGDVCGYIERVSYDASGLAAEFSKSWFDQNAVRYINRMQ